jgi:hypothetical protein
MAQKAGKQGTNAHLFNPKTFACCHLQTLWDDTRQAAVIGRIKWPIRKIVNLVSANKWLNL